MKVKLSILLALVLLIGCFSGCKGKQEQKVNMEAMYAANVKEAPVKADPEQAVAAVYQQVVNEQGECKADKLTALEFTDVTGVASDDVIDFIAYKSNPSSGLADVMIVKPYPSLREDVRAKLVSYKESRIREFENFDILDSYSIAKQSVIYDQGEYLVLLMLSDNIGGQTEIDKYIPQ